MSDWIWIVANVGLGLPLAAFVVLAAREALRAVVALGLGFRVFEIQLGAGPRHATRSVGALDVTLAPWPLAGATAARSGSPRRHRLARGALAIAPALGQLFWLLGRLATGTPPGTAPLFEGPAPLACLDLANVLLLVAHASLAIEFGPRTRSDVRLLLDALVTLPDAGRLARANYYARLARHHLDRGAPTRAHDAIALGRRQLGPVPVLDVCREALSRSELDSVVGRGDCSDLLREAIARHEPRRREERATWARGERLRQRAWSAIPLLLAVVLLVAAQTETALRRAERGLLALGTSAAERGDTDQCQRLSDTWAAWIASVDPWLPPSERTRSERHRGLAALAECRGDRSRHRSHQSEALLAAQAATREDLTKSQVAPADWWADTLRVATLLRETAEVAGREERHRDALRTLHQAEKRLGHAETRLVLLEEPALRARAAEAIETERSAISAARDRILATIRAAS